MTSDQFLPAVVLVVGAGASVPFGFPTGLGLRSRIIETPIDRKMLPIDEPPEEVGAVKKQLMEIVNRFHLSGLYSIDNFLQINTEDQVYGRRLIAHHLMAHQLQIWNNPSLASDWYAWLFNSLLSVSAGIPVYDNLGIVTFNYDNSLERSMYIMARNTNYRMGSAVRLPKILHVYGSLFDSDYVSQDVFPDSFSRLVSHAASRIRLVSSERLASSEPNEGDVAVARKWVRHARALIFLGFGYDLENLKLLGFPRHYTNTSWPLDFVGGTMYGMKTSERRTAIDRIGADERMGQIGAVDERVLDYLRDKVNIKWMLTNYRSSRDA